MGTTSHHFCRALERVEATQRSKPRARQGWAGPRQPEPGAGPRTAAASPQRKVTSESTGGSLELFFGGCTAVSPPQPVSYHSRSHQKRLPTLRNRSLSLSLSHPCLLSLSLSPLFRPSVHPSINPSTPCAPGGRSQGALSRAGPGGGDAALFASGHRVVELGRRGGGVRESPKGSEGRPWGSQGVPVGRSRASTRRGSPCSTGTTTASRAG